MKTVIVAALLLLASTALPAQWIDYPTPGVPKNADGSPLAAHLLDAGDEATR